MKTNQPLSAGHFSLLFGVVSVRRLSARAGLSVFRFLIFIYNESQLRFSRLTRISFSVKTIMFLFAFNSPFCAAKPPGVTAEPGEQGVTL
jgi:hypothetical protein